MQFGVMVVEDDPVLRAGLVQAVDAAPDMHVVAQADDLPEASRLLLQVRPDVLLVDIGLPSGSGIDLIRLASQSMADCDVMVITVFGDERHVLDCIAAGATGYLLKGANAGGIAEQVRALREGGSPISPRIARHLLGRLVKTVAAEDSALSLQERRVLELCSKGYNFEEIAGLLEISRHTVETYIKRIYRKLQVHSRAEAVYEARKLGIFSD